MFHVLPRKESITPQQRQRFEDIATSTLGHFTDIGAIATLLPVKRPVRLLGTAITVRIPHVDGSIIREALTMARPGDVLVIDVGSDVQRACWGEFRAYAALQKSLAGVVTNGSVTDWAHLSQLTLPTFARGTSPLTTRALSLEGEINTPITIEGCAVTPGDLIIGDDDGLFVIPPHRAEALASAAEEKQAQEHEKRRLLRAKHPAWFC